MPCTVLWKVKIQSNRPSLMEGEKYAKRTKESVGASHKAQTCALRSAGALGHCKSKHTLHGRALFVNVAKSQRSLAHRVSATKNGLEQSCLYCCLYHEITFQVKSASYSWYQSSFNALILECDWPHGEETELPPWTAGVSLLTGFLRNPGKSLSLSMKNSLIFQPVLKSFIHHSS